MFTRKHFGEMLSNKLSETNDIVALSRWSYELFLDHQLKSEEGLRDILLDLTRMEDSPEFEYSIIELKKLANDLQNEGNEARNEIDVR
jgi:hypothetical protein